MAFKAFAGLLIVITLSPGWLWPAAGHDATNDLRFDAAELNDKTLWTQVNSEPYRISTALDALCRAPTAWDYWAERRRTGNPHMAPSIVVYVNNLGREAMFAKQPQFPKGSMIVKKKFGPRGQLDPPQLYTLMRKREAGYNPEVGDWEFSVVAGDGKFVQAVGKLQNCQTCHRAKPDSDFVFRPYVKFE